MNALTHPSPQERRQIAALSLMPERQVLKVYRTPTRVQPSTLERVRRAAAQLGYVAPQEKGPSNVP